MDISSVSARDLLPLLADLWLLSPSCQPYTTINPFAKGSADPRGKSFIHLIEDVLPELVSLEQQPRYLLIENVAGFEVPSMITLNRFINNILPYPELHCKTILTVDSEITGLQHTRTAFNTPSIRYPQLSFAILSACQNGATGVYVSSGI